MLKLKLSLLAFTCLFTTFSLGNIKISRSQARVANLEEVIQTAAEKEVAVSFIYFPETLKMSS